MVGPAVLELEAVDIFDEYLEGNEFRAGGGSDVAGYGARAEGRAVDGNSFVSRVDGVVEDIRARRACGLGEP
jgi:hypothetical protein